MIKAKRDKTNSKPNTILKLLY